MKEDIGGGITRHDHTNTVRSQQNETACMRRNRRTKEQLIHPDPRIATRVEANGKRGRKGLRHASCASNLHSHVTFSMTPMGEQHRHPHVLVRIDSATLSE